MAIRLAFGSARGGAPHVPQRFVRCAAAVGTALLLSLQGVSWGAAPAASAIAWQVASTDAEVDKAFQLARQSGKPVFLYWGAVWCPPCNQVQATLFSRADFAERSRAFIPVYVDGDKPGAQKVAARFKVSGYPTMILFKPDGSEVTRLPGEVDPERYLLTLTAGLNAQIPVKDLVQRGLARQPLTPEQWRLLGFYSWDTDEQQVLKTSELPARLSELSAAVPADLPQVRDRLAFKALAARTRAKPAPEKAEVDADRVFVDRLLSRSADAAAMGELLVYYAEPSVKYLATTPEQRSVLATKWDAALERAISTGTMSRGEQVDALDARVDLWKFVDRAEKLAPQRQRTVLREVAQLISQTTDRYERQAVVPSAAHVLTSAGLIDDSDALLKAELPRAVAPYYHMLGLGSNAKKRGNAKAALDWYEQAWRKSEGPATRLQWGVTYVKEIAELAPTDLARMAAAAGAVISGLEPRSETFFERNHRSLQRMAKKLGEWQGKDPARTRVVGKMKDQLSRTCAKLPAKDPGRVNCESVFGGSAANP
ncbi:MAG: putative disulfide-isomerase [Ramlibacter sp.]|nr:putative disulfide-isomerase [Ramlibacter sp.]